MGLIFLVLTLIVLFLFYLHSSRNFKYWEKRGVKNDPPIVLFGNNLEGYTFRKSLTQILTEIYKKYPNEKVVGYFRSTRPELVIRDPRIVRRILINDFVYFYPRGFNATKKWIEPLAQNLFVADGDLWKLLRQRMTAAFTSGKLRAMFPLIVERAERLQVRALTAATMGNPIDVRELMARYTTDFIGAVAFGLDGDSLNDEESAFRKIGVKIFNTSFANLFRLVLAEIFPTLFERIRLHLDYEEEFISLIKQILIERNYESSGRNDFIDLLLECKKKGTILGESIEKFKVDGTPEVARLDLTDELLAAQVFVFFAAGFETSSSATSYTLHELAHNKEVQKKVQIEVDRVLKKFNNKLSYDAIMEMTYLEWTFKEAMRKFPSLGFLVRECARKYTFPDLHMTIDKGVRVFFPLQAVHNDPKFFPNPEVFRPERFNPEEFDHSKKQVYLPFGAGPRACIGERMGLMQSLAGLAAILSRFTVRPASGTKKKLKINPRSTIVQSVIGGIPLLLELRAGVSFD